MVTETEYPISRSLFKSYYTWKPGTSFSIIVYVAFALNIRTLNLKVLNSCSADRIMGTSLLLNNSTVSLNTDSIKFKETA